MVIFCLALVVFAGIVALVVHLNRRAFVKATQRWAANLQLVEGRPDRGSAWVGTFEGRPVRWSIKGQQQSETSVTYYYKLTMTFTPGGKKWRISYNKPGLLNHAPEGWRVTTKAKDLDGAFQTAGFVQLMDGWVHYISVAHDPKRGNVSLEFALAGYNYVPTSEVFLRQLRLLQGLGRLDEQIRPMVR